MTLEHETGWKLLRSLRTLSIPLLLLTATACGGGAPEEVDYDLLITGARVLDGTGAPGYEADLAIVGERIERVSKRGIRRLDDRPVIDATGLVLAPGFIDLHAHLNPLLRLPDAESHVRQGVTTALGGPDGTAPWPLGEHLDSAATLGVGLNVAFLTGHNTIRRRVMGNADRAPTPDELAEMQRMVAQAMGEGAFGISTGLKYLPGAFSEIDEVIALSQVASDSGGIYTSHLREEGLELLEGVAEAIEIGRRASIPIVLTHHKVVGRPMWGSSKTTLAMVDSARAEGIDVVMDQYPYTATHTGITILIPSWARADGNRAFLRRVEDPALRDSIIDGIIFNIENDRGGGDLRRVQFSRVPWDRSLEGKTLYDWAISQGKEATPEVGAELVIEAVRRGGASAVFHALDEDDVRRIMRHEQTMIASDGRLTRPGEGHPHPRSYGTFPRVLGHYVRDEGVLTLEEAVKKMTFLPAERLGLEDRGRIAEGAYADLVLFDPETVADQATFEDPHQYPAGIEYVFVNGVGTVIEGEFHDLRPGKVLRRGR